MNEEALKIHFLRVRLCDIKGRGREMGRSLFQINYYCYEGHIPGAEKIRMVCMIPKDVSKPVYGWTKHGRSL